MAIDTILIWIIILVIILVAFWIFHMITLKIMRKNLEKSKTIAVCPNCGSTNRQMAGLFLGPYGPAKFKCTECKYEGIFMEVDKDKLDEFRKTLKKKHK